MEVDSFTPRPVYSLAKTADTHWMDRCKSPTTELDVVVKKKSLPLLGNESCPASNIASMTTNLRRLLRNNTRLNFRHTTFNLINKHWGEFALPLRITVENQQEFNLLKPTGHVMHQHFNIQQLYVLPTLYLCVLYLSENNQRLVPLIS